MMMMMMMLMMLLMLLLLLLLMMMMMKYETSAAAYSMWLATTRSSSVKIICLLEPQKWQLVLPPRYPIGVADEPPEVTPSFGWGPRARPTRHPPS